MVKAAFCEESEEKVQQEYDYFEYARNSENITEKWGEVIAGRSREQDSQSHNYDHKADQQTVDSNPEQDLSRYDVTT